MKRDLRLFIEDILNAVNNVEIFSKGLTKECLEKDELYQSAIIRQIEIMGEAVKNIPDSFKNMYPEIPWRNIAGMRDVIIHGYFNVDLNTLWLVIKKDIINLKEKIIKIRKDMESKDLNKS